MNNNRPTLMKCTCGITTPNLTAEPLGTEGELTEGPDHINPYRSVQEREIVDDLKQRRREKEDGKLWKSGLDDPGIEMDPDLPGVDFYIKDSGPQF